MDDLRPSRPLPSTGVEKFTPKEKEFPGRAREKKTKTPETSEERTAIPPIDGADSDSKHQLDEHA